MTGAKNNPFGFTDEQVAITSAMNLADPIWRGGLALYAMHPERGLDACIEQADMAFCALADRLVARQLAEVRANGVYRGNLTKPPKEHQ